MKLTKQPGGTLAKRLIWTADEKTPGWACSQCQWIFSRLTLLTEIDAKQSYDRLAAESFQKHDCTTYVQRVNQSREVSFAEKARNLIMRGFTPKNAVELTLREIEFEHRGHPTAVEKAQVDAEDFIRRVKEGLI